MRLHSLIGWPTLRLIAASFLMVIWGGAAYAYDFDFSYRQNRDVAVSLQPVTNAPSDQTCPEHAGLVQISTKIDLAEIGTITIEPNLPEILRAGRIDYGSGSYIDQNAAMDIEIDLLGCVFRQNFLPLNGQFTISGDYDVGRIADEAAVFVSNDNRRSSPKVDYQTHWSGLVHGFAPGEAVRIPGLLQDQIMGTLTLDLSRLDAPLTSDDRPVQLAMFSRLRLRFIVVSD